MDDYRADYSADAVQRFHPGGEEPDVRRPEVTLLDAAIPLTSPVTSPEWSRWRRAFTVIGSIFWLSILLRAMAMTDSRDPALTRWIVATLVVFFALFLTAQPVSLRLGWYPRLYFALQGTLVLALLFIEQHPGTDFYAALLIPVSAHVFILSSGPSRYRWIAAYIGATAIGLISILGWPTALPFILLYASSYIFVASYAEVTLKAQIARERTRLLLADLQLAYDQLQAYSAQTRELAIVAERTRLARDLHDAVSQNLFSLTLAAETAARGLHVGRADLASAQIAEVKELARQALGELRLLVFELRPALLEQEGLAASLQMRLEAVEARAGLETELDTWDTNGCRSRSKSSWTASRRRRSTTCSSTPGRTVYRYGCVPTPARSSWRLPTMEWASRLMPGNPALASGTVG